MVDDVAAIEAGSETAGLIPSHLGHRPEDAVRFTRCRALPRHHPVAVAAHYGRTRDSFVARTLKSLGNSFDRDGCRTSGQKWLREPNAVLTDLAVLQIAVITLPL